MASDVLMMGGDFEVSLHMTDSGSKESGRVSQQSGEMDGVTLQVTLSIARVTTASAGDAIRIGLRSQGWSVLPAGQEFTHNWTSRHWGWCTWECACAILYWEGSCHRIRFCRQTASR